MTALRELAERWKARASLSDGEDDLAFANNTCAAELLAILNAEGDGGAVAWPKKMMDRADTSHVYGSGYAAALRDAEEHLTTHPARSGVVRDEDVEAACAIYFGGQHWPHGVEEVELVRISMRAALTHFAKGERHER